MPADVPPAPLANAPPEYTVSELSQKLKRTVEEAFSFVRVRGELSRITVAKSGHLYTDLKDNDSVINAICWKGSVARLSVRPEEGMDVVVTGRLTTYPGRSNYQLIIETMELAGQGALLKMLEERRRKLAAEGLFDAARKKAIPFLPRRIGVITSPTGAVIRDIMHRLADRFPSHVLVWPVVVQGQGAAQQVAAAIAGFNSLPAGHPLRPDVLIVARGGGSLEDLMPFNDEIVVRAAAASAIPLISAVGHETDTTLIDYAADLRAPTPTAAAEKAVPVRRELMALMMDHDKRLFGALQKALQRHRLHVQGLARGLGDPRRLMEHASQRLDYAAHRLDSGLSSWLSHRRADLRAAAARLSARPLENRIHDYRRQLTGQRERLDQGLGVWLQRRRADVSTLSARLTLQPMRRQTTEGARQLAALDERLQSQAARLLQERAQRLRHASALLDSLSFERVLERGFAVVFDEKGNVVSSSAEVQGDMTLRFKDGDVGVTKKK